jgi:hypothetical protein
MVRIAELFVNALSNGLSEKTLEGLLSLQGCPVVNTHIKQSALAVQFKVLLPRDIKTHHHSEFTRKFSGS